MNAVTNSYQENLKELRKNLGKILPESALNVFDKDAENLQKKHQSILKLQVGEKAPDFSLLNVTDKTIKLSELLKQRKVVLTFYRGSWCPNCNINLLITKSH